MTKISEYRKQCEDEIEAGRGDVAAYAEAGQIIEGVSAAIELLANRSAPVEDRMGAMALINAATFQPVAFAPFHAEYDLLLRDLATDKVKAIRVAALERLALVGDAYAHELLVEGLEGKRRPLVSAAKAAQLLGSDDHNAARPALRRLAASTTGKPREEALRALANDPQSTALFESIAANKEEPQRVREIAALSMRQTSPARFAKLAEKIILDDDDNDRVRATTMSAVAYADDVRRQLKKKKFSIALEVLRQATKSAALKASIREFKKLSALDD